MRYRTIDNTSTNTMEPGLSDDRPVEFDVILKLAVAVEEQNRLLEEAHERFQEAWQEALGEIRGQLDRIEQGERG